MDIKRAIVIFNNIQSDLFTDEEKATAIYEVMNMPTHMSIKKETVFNALKWLWYSAYEFEGGAE